MNEQCVELISAIGTFISITTNVILLHLKANIRVRGSSQRRAAQTKASVRPLKLGDYK